jgi:hypothetical protein
MRFGALHLDALVEREGLYQQIPAILWLRLATKTQQVVRLFSL